MNSDTQARVAAIATMFGAFGASSDGNRITIYAEMLKDIPVDVLKVACRKAIMERKFLPAISEIVESATSLVGTADDKLRVRTWEEAWREINNAMFTTPWGETPSWSSAEIAAAVDAFGWHNLHTANADDMPTIRAQIRRFYEDACKRIAEDKRNKYLINFTNGLLHEAGTKRKGFLEAGKRA